MSERFRSRATRHQPWIAELEKKLRDERQKAKESQVESKDEPPADADPAMAPTQSAAHTRTGRVARPRPNSSHHRGEAADRSDGAHGPPCGSDSSRRGRAPAGPPRDRRRAHHAGGHRRAAPRRGHRHDPGDRVPRRERARGAAAPAASIDIEDGSPVARCSLARDPSRVTRLLPRSSPGPLISWPRRPLPVFPTQFYAAPLPRARLVAPGGAAPRPRHARPTVRVAPPGALRGTPNHAVRSVPYWTPPTPARTAPRRIDVPP